MDEIKLEIRNLIEKEYKEALKKGLFDPGIIVNKIWKLLIENNAVDIPVPEAVYGCFESFEEID